MQFADIDGILELEDSGADADLLNRPLTQRAII